ncbi:fatty acyl-CoA reductase wat-like [Drosophila novamexicana]|uniref:fatty acyl-CoA reductase wat-like n=1 Tax=Drosophila novamexicana TaxID=47314 RepID=UPI0011E5D476|nr:fatty acyl-CoA reductase wat-like [Drosophila novamexicana]
MDSNITEFYKNKTIFLTGGSGFLGKLIIEKLLRTTEVERIYMLIRPKRGEQIQSRMAAFRSNFMFTELLKLKANSLEKVMPIAGDCALPDLGLSEADRQLLTEEVQVVVHGAATVNFVEPLSSALSINTRATRLLVQLAKQMGRLEAYVHVSTAFSNCPVEHIRECFYPELLSCTADKALALQDQLSAELIDKMTPALLGKFPNTYTYTKALAEQVVQREAADLPICIFRPGMILPSLKEPFKGCIDNLYGPIASAYGCAAGVLRVVPSKKESRTNIVPVDYCVNLVLSSAWQTAVATAQRRAQHPAPDPPIYNFAPTAQNPTTWGQITGWMEKYIRIYPVNQAIWFPFTILISNLWLFKLLIVLYHHLPGFLIDTALRLKGQKPRMKRIYSRIHESYKMLVPFTFPNWTFEMGNSDRLLKSMSPQDRLKFEFDLNGVDWMHFLSISIMGVRVNLLKEELTEESLQSARKLCKRFLIINCLVHFIACCIPAALLWWVYVKF